MTRRRLVGLCPVGRREFGEIVAGSIAAVLSACESSHGAEAQRFGDVSAGNVAELSVGSIVALQGVSACIARDERGIYAMTLTCTHVGCDMGVDGRIAASPISCSCHGSRFDAHGAVVRGPATDPLQHFAVTSDAQGNLMVHGAAAVGPDARLSV